MMEVFWEILAQLWNIAERIMYITYIPLLCFVWHVVTHDSNK